MLKEQIIEENIQKYGKQLYHYTSIFVFKNIVSKKELWMGNTADMNDKKELLDFIDKLEDAVTKEILENSPEHYAKCKIFFEKTKQRLTGEYPFASCFSRLKDDAAQWERYADNAKGVCIAFNTEKLTRLTCSMSHLSNPSSLDEIYYNYDIKKHDLYKIIVNFLRGIETPPLTLQQEDRLIELIINTANIRKHNSFASEQEIRLIMLDILSNAVFKESYEVVNGKIKKFVKIDLDKLCQDPEIDFDFEDLIDEIIIGPRSEQNIHILEEFLKEMKCEKLSQKVSKSDSPLR